MAILTTAQIAFACGILGNIVSFLVYLAPLTTFYRIYKKKSTQGFQSIPYSVALFSAMLYLYYAFLKKNATLLITINSFGSAIETMYLIIFMIYATKEAKTYTAKLLILFNFAALGLIMVLTYLLSKGSHRVAIVGWICAIFSVTVFAAPLSIMKQVIKTKSVEFMPFNLSLFLTFCAVMWFFYSLLIKDYYIAMNTEHSRFTFGIAQMILYAIYRNQKKQAILEVKLQDLPTVIDLTAMEKQMNSETATNNKPEEDDHNAVQNKDNAAKAIEPSETNV